MAVSIDLYKHMGIEPGQPLPAFAWPGLYPLFYWDEENTPLCSTCANIDGYTEDIIGGEINWEDTDLRCCDCGNSIPSAYDNN